MSKIHIVEQGECLSSIAGKYGFQNYRAIYEHADNADFRRRRPNPNLIYPGDELVIPEAPLEVFVCKTGQLNRFVVKRPERKLHLKLRDGEGEAIAGADYELSIEGDPDPRKGQTGNEGEVEELIPFDATSAKLLIGELVLEFEVGHLNPMFEVKDDGVSGIQARLANLGYFWGSGDGQFGEDTEAAIRLFQEDHDLDVDGLITDDLRTKLAEVHGV